MTVQPHAVAALLNDEQRARIKAATFVKFGNGIATPGAAYACQCPFAVALNIPSPWWPTTQEVADALHTDQVEMIRLLLADIDNGHIAPEDVKALLGCADEDGAS